MIWAQHCKEESAYTNVSDLLTQHLNYFSENKCILQYDKQYAKNSTGNTHKYLNDLFAVCVIPKAETVQCNHKQLYQLF